MKWCNGKKEWKLLFSTTTKNSIQDSVGNEQNHYPVPDLNKTMINVTKEQRDTYIKTLKEKILEDITEKFMEKIPDMVNQYYKMHSRNFKTPKII
jgi:hypothetical protein